MHQLAATRESTVKNSRILQTAGLLMLLVACISSFGASEEGYPSKPVVLVVPYPPGGSGDVQARIIAGQLERRLGQPFVIENRPGAGTMIGAVHVAHAAPDGYTLLISSSATFTLNPAIRKALPYDPVKSFQPIGMLSRVGLVMLASNATNLHSLRQAAAALKAAPNRFAFASFGVGTSSHFAGALAANAMGIQPVHVPYSGSALAMKDLIGGRVPFLFDALTTAAPQARAGKVKPLAVTSAKRSPLLPDVPTFAESGYPEVVFDSWGMLVGPRGLPPGVLAKLEAALRDTIADPTVRRRLTEQGVEPVFANAAQSAAYLDVELPLMRATAVRANIRAE
jgi:tripartite-type tricarboxylate transporter receptor subunit TctC